MKHFFISLALMMVALLSVAMLVRSTKSVATDKNGFNRNIINNGATLIKSARLGNGFKYICGLTPSGIYLSANTIGQVVRTGFDLESWDTIQLPLSDYLLYKLKKTNSVIIDTPWFYVFDGNARMFIKGRFDDSNVITVYQTPSTFSRGLAVNSNSVALRVYNVKLKDQQFARYNLSSRHISYEQGVSPMVKDGGLSMDGMMISHAMPGLFAFVHYYSNEVLVVDSTLRVVRRGRTIDTFSRSTLHAGLSGKGNDKRFTNNQPARFINKACVFDSNYLYVYSLAKADNEEYAEFAKGATIDIYNAASLAYTGSIRLQEGTGAKLRNLAIKGDTLLVMYKDAMALYKLHIDKPI